MLIAIKEVGLEVKVQKAKYMCVIQQRYAGRHHNTQIINHLRMRKVKIFGKDTNKPNLTAYKN
jgi:hypothetical protein